MFDKILVANRGEIACRVIRTARLMGIKTVAVFSEADSRARHVDMADEAVCIGPPPAAESYLRGDIILEVARRTGVQAIHPGYGFLSESAGFAEACAAAGVIFIGPPVNAIRVMGSKSASKHVMGAADVPLVPGYHDDDQDFETLAAAAQAIGYPVLVKATAGGGGKGMRIVREPEGLADAIGSARREAKASFGDDQLLLEKYLTRPRHVEMQVFGDQHGNVVHLFERDCSTQRRHQKVIEEAPAPALRPEVRRRLGEAAVAAARAVNYVGAGTVEFLYQDDQVYFIEMNTRLQVEHPVTEAITGFDLVEWQLRVAAGQPLPVTQDQITCNGHAFEARIYAEDPQREFLPSIGRLVHLKPPAENRHIRVDTGVSSGDRVSVYYDPMIAKLVVWDQSRDAALRWLRSALAAYEVAGVTTNLGFLSAIASHPAFAAVEIDTGFIERHRDALLPPPQPVPAKGMILAALAVLLRRNAQAMASVHAASDPWSPWRQASGWRLNEGNHNDLSFIDGQATREVTVHFRRDGYEIIPEPGATPITAQQATLDASGVLTVTIDRVKTRAMVVAVGLDLTILCDGAQWRLQIDDPTARADQSTGGGGRLTAPMPGTITRILVEAGAAVQRGTPLLVLEAMKMEHTITAPANGTVAAINYRVGDQVTDGVDLLVFEADAES